MSTITKVSLQNFQSHADSTIELAPSGQLTVITGCSDSGKTALLRGLKWLLYNAPQGVDFIRVGCTFARVSVILTDGTQVIRERSRSTYNRYIIVKGEDRQVFEGFGVEPPWEIKQILGIQTLTFGDLEIAPNLAEQLDGPFLGKAVSAGTRAKVLGKLAGTEEIDLAGKQLGTDLYRRNQEEKRLAAELAGLEEQIKTFDYLPAMVNRITTLESLVAGIKAAQERRRLLAEKQTMLKQLEAGIAAAEAMVKRWQYLDLAEIAVAGAEIAQAKKTALQRLEASLAGVEAGIQAARDTLARCAQLNEAEEAAGYITMAIERRKVIGELGDLFRSVSLAVNAAEVKLSELAGVEEAGAVVVRIDEARARRSKLAELAGRLRQAEAEEKRSREAALLWEQRVADLAGAYKDALIQSKICPTCGGTIDPARLREVI